MLVISSFWKNSLSYIFRICAIFYMFVKCKEIKPVNSKGNQSWTFIHWKDRCWSWNSNILTTSYEELTHLKRSWSWEILKVEGEGGNRGWHGWMASPAQWTWVWVSSRSWWLTGRPGVLQAMVLQRVDTTEQLNWLKTQEDMFPKPATFVCRLDVYLG